MSRRLPDREGLAGFWQRVDPVPERITEDARLAFARRLHPVVVLALVADSSAGTAQAARVGLAGEPVSGKVLVPRRVRFVGGRVSVGMMISRAQGEQDDEDPMARPEAADYRITGSVEPPPSGVAWLERASGDMVVEISSSGTFSCTRLAGGPFRLVWSERGADTPRYFATEWLVL